MKKSTFTEEQIAFALRQAETGTAVAEVVRKMGVSEQTFYRWKKLYAGMGVGELRRMKQLEEENRKLKQLVADRPVARQGDAAGCNPFKAVKPGVAVSSFASCKIAIGLASAAAVRSYSHRYRSCRDNQAFLRHRIREARAFGISGTAHGRSRARTFGMDIGGSMWLCAGRGCS